MSVPLVPKSLRHAPLAELLEKGEYFRGQNLGLKNGKSCIVKPIDPHEIPDKVACSKHISNLIGTRNDIRFNLKALKNHQLYTHDDVKELREVKIGDFLSEHKDLSLYLKPFVTDGEQDHSLVELLKTSPQLGSKLGAVAERYRMLAHLDTVEPILKHYNEIDGKGKLKTLKQEGRFTMDSRFRTRVKSLGNSLMDWIRSNPILGGTSAVAVLILIKVAVLIFVIDVLQHGHKEKKLANASQKNVTPNNGTGRQAAAQQAAVTQPVAVPAMNFAQASAYPAPFLTQAAPPVPYPTPLQTALNIAA